MNMRASSHKSHVHHIGGRRFVSVRRTTVGQDVELMRILKVAGLRDLSMRDGESPEDFVWRTVEQLVESKLFLPMLGCLVVPEECAPRERGWFERLGSFLVGVRDDPRAQRRKWSAEVQAETAAFLGDLDSPDDKQVVYQVMADELLPFLQAGIVSWLRSPRSSAAAVDPPVVIARSPSPSSIPGAG